MTEWEKVELCELYDGNCYVIIRNGHVDSDIARNGTIDGASHVLVDDTGDPLEVPDKRLAP